MTADYYEPVSASRALYRVPRRLAHKFAAVVGINDPQNFSRAMDPSDDVHVFVEGWQPLYNVRWLEKLGANGAVEDYILIWGQPKKTLTQFYENACRKWKALPPFNTFRLALPEGSKRTMKGFRVSKLTAAATRARLAPMDLPSELQSDAEFCAREACNPKRFRTIAPLALPAAPRSPARCERPELTAAPPLALQPLAGRVAQHEPMQEAYGGSAVAVQQVRFGAFNPSRPCCIASAHTLCTGPPR